MRLSDKFITVSVASLIMGFLVLACGEDKPAQPVQPTTGTVTDIDGNVYKTVKIGTQWWMAENLRVTHYRNGDVISVVADSAAWITQSTGACCEYDADIDNVPTYGRLYNWHAVIDVRGMAPEGWHVPTDAEWKQLEVFIGMSQAQADSEYNRGSDEGLKLKEKGTTHWSGGNVGATNASGFSGLPGGYRHADGYYGNIGLYAYWWCSSEFNSNEAWWRNLYASSSQVFRYHSAKRFGLSVRCVKN